MLTFFANTPESSKGTGNPRAGEHDQKVAGERGGHKERIERVGNDVFAFHDEQDQDGEEQGNQGYRIDDRDELFVVPLLS